MSNRDSTCVTVLTPGGRGAVAVVAVEGSAAVEAVDRYFQPANLRALRDQQLGRIVYGHWGNRDGEDLVVCRRGENALEIHCHGGQQSSAQIVADLSDAGCLVREADSWLANQHKCPLAAAAQLALAQTTTLRTAKILLAQYHGALRGEIEAIIAELADGNISAANKRLERLLNSAEFGRHLTKPWRVVIAGQPNVGKSSLINALVGYERAIVFDQPGTTRDVVSSSTAIEGWPVELSDTAGLHETSDEIETAGIALARERLLVANLVVWVLDAVETTSAGDLSDWDLAQQQAREVGVQLKDEKTLIVVNKIDLVAISTGNISTDEKSPTVGTCAISGRGLEQLLSTIAARLVPVVPLPGEAVPFTARQVELLQAALDAIGAENNSAASALLHQLLSSHGESGDEG